MNRIGIVRLSVGVCLLAAVVAGAAENWYRGNTHTHTVICGHADSTPEFVTAWYHERGYNFLILSEHNHFIDPATVTMPAETREDFILIPGVEVSGAAHIHSTAMNVRDSILWKLLPWKYNHKTKAKVIENHAESAQKAGGELILNHPNFHYAIKAKDMRPVEQLHMFELYNGHPSVNNHGNHKHASTEEIWDELLTDGKQIYGVSSDDAHHFQTIAPNKSNPGRGWVMVQAAELAPEAITTAMKTGNFYASNGVFLTTCKRGPKVYEMVVDDTRTQAELTGNPLLRGKFIGEGEAGYRIEFIGPGGKVLKRVDGTRAEFAIPEGIAYVRAKVTLTKKHPKKDGVEEYYAWGQPVFGDR